MNKKQIDKILFFVVLMLCWIGIIAVFGSSTEIANSYFNNRFHFIIRQFIWFLFGILILFIFMKIPIERLQSLSKIALLISFVMLLMVFFVGTEVKGATRWINLGLFNLQPSTISQFILIIFTADYLTRRHNNLSEFKRLFPILIILCIFGLMIALQPDFSTSATIVLTVFIMFFISPIPFKNLSIVMLSGLIIAIPIFVIESYRIKRILSWLNQADAQNTITNWQSYQSVTSFGLGGWFGVGFGYSRQKFFFLPEAHTDYILAIIGEEMGFIGVSFVTILFLILVWRGFKIANHATTLLHYYLAAGITIYLGIYAFVNILVVIGLLPTTGLPLPFISYGGNQLLINLACVGLLLNISSVGQQSIFRADKNG